MSTQEILAELQAIRNLLEEQLTEKKPQPLAEIILVLPGHLQQTMIGLTKQKDYAGTALQLSMRTHRKRAVESNYLNQLTRLKYNGMPYVTKTHVGRRAVFQINFDLLQK